MPCILIAMPFCLWRSCFAESWMNVEQEDERDENETNKREVEKMDIVIRNPYLDEDDVIIKVENRKFREWIKCRSMTQWVVVRDSIFVWDVETRFCHKHLTDFEDESSGTLHSIRFIKVHSPTRWCDGSLKWQTLQQSKPKDFTISKWLLHHQCRKQAMRICFFMRQHHCYTLSSSLNPLKMTTAFSTQPGIVKTKHHNLLAPCINFALKSKC